jgi:methionine synthase I (cobalamin-dependent)
MSRWEQLMQRRTVAVADGAMGTCLQSYATREKQPMVLESHLAVLSAPETVLAVHQMYVQAGAEILLTNTFSASAHQLGRRQLSWEIGRLHRIAAELARRAAGDTVVVLGDLGPMGQFFPPMGTISEEEARQAYAERTMYLMESGCIDGLLIETQFDLREATCAVDGVRRESDLPLVVSMSFDRHGRTMMGVSPEAFAEAMLARDVRWFGANCGRSPEETLAAVKAMRAVAPDAGLWVKPNAGLPQTLPDGRSVYELSPEAFADIARDAVHVGARIVGGCCGTTPEHIARVTGAIRRME